MSKIMTASVFAEIDNRSNHKHGAKIRALMNKTAVSNVKSLLTVGDNMLEIAADMYGMGRIHLRTLYAYLRKGFGEGYMTSARLYIAYRLAMYFPQGTKDRAYLALLPLTMANIRLLVDDRLTGEERHRIVIALTNLGGDEIINHGGFRGVARTVLTNTRGRAGMRRIMHPVAKTHAIVSTPHYRKFLKASKRYHKIFVGGMTRALPGAALGGIIADVVAEKLPVKSWAPKQEVTPAQFRKAFASAL